MSCDTVRANLAVRQELNYAEEQIVQAHLQSCSACQAYWSTIMQSRRDLQQLRSWEGDLAASARVKIEKRLEQTAPTGFMAWRPLAGFALACAILLLVASLSYVWLHSSALRQPATAASTNLPSTSNLAPIAKGSPVLSTSIPLSMTTILVLGSDERPVPNGPIRTDSAALIILSPEHQLVQVMLLPPDLSLSAEQQRMRLGAIYVTGEEQYGHGGGRTLIKQALKDFTSLDINYVVLLRFESFVQLIDQLGGVNVNIPEEVDDPTYPDNAYGTMTIHFDAGPQLLNGEQALIYARTRHGGTELKRLERQQQLIQAIITKIYGQALLTQPTQLNSLISTLQSSIDTDLPVTTLLSWAAWGAGIDPQHIRVGPLDTHFIPPEGAPTPAPTLANRAAIPPDPMPTLVWVDRLDPTRPWIWQPGQACGHEGGLLLSPQSNGEWAQLRSPVLALAERSAQSPLLLICSDNGTLALLDTQSWKTIDVPIPASANLSDMRATPDGNGVVFNRILPDGNAMLMLADVQTGNVTALEATSTSGDAFTPLAWQGTKLLLQRQTSATSTLWQIDTATDQPVLEKLLTIGETGVIAAAPDGSMLAWSYSGEALMLRQLPGGNDQELSPYTNAETHVVISPDSQTLALIERYPTNNNPILRLYDLTSKPIQQRGVDIPIDKILSWNGQPAWHWSADSQQLMLATETKLISIDHSGALLMQTASPENTRINDLRSSASGVIMLSTNTISEQLSLSQTHTDGKLETIVLPAINSGSYRIVYSP